MALLIATVPPRWAWQWEPRAPMSPLETADIALMADDLEKLPLAVQLSRGTLVIIQQKVAFAIAVKALFLVLGDKILMRVRVLSRAYHNLFASVRPHPCQLIPGSDQASPERIRPRATSMRSTRTRRPERFRPCGG